VAALALVTVLVALFGTDAPPEGRLVALVASCAALAALALARRGRWRESTAWFSLLALSFAASLHLIEAPPAVAYQHARLTPRAALDFAAFAVLAAQAIMVLVGGRRRLADALHSARASFNVPLLLVGLLLFALVSAAPSRDPRFHVAELIFATAVQLLSLLTMILAIAAAPERGAAAVRPLQWLLGREGEPAPRRPDRWSLTLAATVTVVTALLAVLVYERHPHVPDEVIYLLHARYLADGMLSMPLPPVPAAFNLDLMHYDPVRWFSPVPPGWPFVLAIGARLGVPWLVNPVLGGLAVLLTRQLLGTIYEDRESRLATLLLATSPWFLFMSMNLMPHQLTLVCALAAALGAALARRAGSLVPAFAGGLATGAVSLIRPLEGLAVAMVVGLWSLGARKPWFRFAPSAAVVAGAMLTGALVLPYNALLTGSARVFPIMAYVDKYYEPGANDLGFGPNRGLGWSGLDPFPGHGPADVVVNGLLNGFQVNVELLGWPVGVVLLLAVASALRAPRWNRADWWQWVAIAVVVGLHCFYWFSGGPDFGARYWYLIVVPLAALVARSLVRFASRSPAGDAPAAAARARALDPRPVAAGLALGALALLLFVPWRSLGKYHRYRNMRPDVRALALEHGFGRSLVLVRGRRFPDYASAAAYNPLDLQGDSPVYAWDATPDLRSALLGHYEDRPVWILDGPSVTGAGFRVAAGPMTAAEARGSSVYPTAAGDSVNVYDPVNPPARAARP
jgi:hypothetical protein